MNEETTRPGSSSPDSDFFDNAAFPVHSDDRTDITSVCETLSLNSEFLLDILARDAGYRLHIGSENVIREKLEENYFKFVYDADNIRSFFQQVGFTEEGASKMQTFIQDRTDGGLTHYSLWNWLTQYLDTTLRPDQPQQVEGFPYPQETNGTWCQINSKQCKSWNNRILYQNISSRKEFKKIILASETKEAFRRRERGSFKNF